MANESKSSPEHQLSPETLAAIERSRPEDYDGHTEFHRLTPGQRLDWLDAAADLVRIGKSRNSPELQVAESSPADPASRRIYLSSPHMGGGELEFVKEAFATNWIAPLGPHVDAFEREFVEALSLSRGEGTPPTLDRDVGGLPPGRVGPVGLSRGEGTPPTLDRDVGGLPPGRVGSLHAAALSSGTAALHLALRWLGVGPGDEVICSSLTFSASANPILYERATPVFVDSEERSWNMDPALLAEAVQDGIRRGKKPKAVILVHLYGQSADIDPIAAICARHDIPLIEDAAEALGAVYWRQEGGSKGQGAGGKEQGAGNNLASVISPLSSEMALSAISPGTVGLCGIFSFNGNKIITTSGGGMLVSRDEAMIRKARFWATQSRDPAPHYQHTEIGYNYRLSNVLAGIGRGQLRVLADHVGARRRNFEFYKKALGDLPGLAFMPEAEFGRCTRWLTCLTVDPEAGGRRTDGRRRRPEVGGLRAEAGGRMSEGGLRGPDRETIRLALEKENIEARPVWKPMHRQPVFEGCRVFGGAVSERLFDQGLCLPSGSNLTPTDLERVVDVVRRCFEK